MTVRPASTGAGVDPRSSGAPESSTSSCEPASKDLPRRIRPRIGRGDSDRRDRPPAPAPCVLLANGLEPHLRLRHHLPKTPARFRLVHRRGRALGGIMLKPERHDGPDPAAREEIVSSPTSSAGRLPCRQARQRRDARRLHPMEDGPIFLVIAALGRIPPCPTLLVSGPPGQPRFAAAIRPAPHRDREGRATPSHGPRGVIVAFVGLALRRPG